MYHVFICIMIKVAFRLLGEVVRMYVGVNNVCICHHHWVLSLLLLLKFQTCNNCCIPNNVIVHISLQVCTDVCIQLHLKVCLSVPIWQHQSASRFLYLLPPQMATCFFIFGKFPQCIVVSQSHLNDCCHFIIPLGRHEEVNRSHNFSMFCNIVCTLWEFNESFLFNFFV